MAKIGKSSDIQQEFAFTEFDFYQRHEEFTQKGRGGKNEIKNATKKELARVRATAMEGSFGLL